MKAGRARSDWLWGAAAVAAALGAYAWLGGPGLVLAGIVGSLALVWRYDNWTGSCFMLALLVVLVVGILILLLGLLALQR